MIINNNLRIVFDLPEDTTMIDVIDEILKNNGLEESTEEFLDKDDNGKEPRLIIVRDAAMTMVQKKIPEEKIIELLAKHLETSEETAEKILQEIKEKLIPYAKIIDLEQEKREGEKKEKEIEEKSRIEQKKESAQEVLLQKIRSSKNIPIAKKEKEVTYPKRAPIFNVEKNAENMEKEEGNIITKERGKFTKNYLNSTPLDSNENEQGKLGENKPPQTQENKPDPYKEPIE